MEMAERNLSVLGSTYRYGFNGQEVSNEIAPGLTTALYWEYDSRTGRRWNVDPKWYLMPNYSPYSVQKNNPIVNVDKDGDIASPVIYWLLEKIGSGIIVVFTEQHISVGAAGFYAQGLVQGGKIYQKKGATYYNASAGEAGFINEDGETLVVGVDIDVLDIGAFYQQANEGTDFLRGEAPTAVDVSVADVSWTENGFGLSVGFGLGFGIVKLNYTQYTSFSLSRAEDERMQASVPTGTDPMFSVQNVTYHTDTETGERFQRADLYLTRQKGFFSSETETVRTGVIVTNKSQNDSKQEWKTEAFESEH